MLLLRIARLIREDTASCKISSQFMWVLNYGIRRVISTVVFHTFSSASLFLFIMAHFPTPNILLLAINPIFRRNTKLLLFFYLRSLFSTLCQLFFRSRNFPLEIFPFIYQSIPLGYQSSRNLFSPPPFPHQNYLSKDV